MKESLSSHPLALFVVNGKKTNFVMNLKHCFLNVQLEMDNDQILPSLLQAGVEFALTKNVVTLLKLVNTGYPDLLMKGAEH